MVDLGSHRIGRLSALLALAPDLVRHGYDSRRATVPTRSIDRSKDTSSERAEHLARLSAHTRGVSFALARQTRFMPKKVKEVIAILEDNGWTLVRQSGSHRTYKHADHPLLVTVSGRWNRTVPVGMLTSIRRTSGIEELR